MTAAHCLVRLACLPAIALALGLAAPYRARAEVDRELLDILLANGAITAEQHQQLLDKEELTREDVDDIVVKLDKKGLQISTADGAYQIHIGSRLHADASGNFGSLPGDNNPTNGTELRRARIEMKGLMHELWSWAAEVDFAEDEVSIKDFWLGYEGLEGWAFMIGNQKQPYSLQLEMSSNDIPFIERSIDNDLLTPFVDRAIGIRADGSGEHWFFSAGVFGSTVDSSIPAQDESWAAVTRFVYAPLHDEQRAVHLGVRGAFRQASDPNDSVRVRSETTHISNVFPLNTGFIDDVQNTWLVGPELAFAWGPFSFFGEYTHAFMTREGGDSGGRLDFDGFHVEAAWALTGESRAAAYRIDSGEFKRLTPKRNFSLANHGPGAWEVAGRYAFLDVTDGDVRGGRAGTVTTALNWYVNENIRFMLDWTYWLHSSGDTPLQQETEGLNVVQFRAQYTY